MAAARHLALHVGSSAMVRAHFRRRWNLPAAGPTAGLLEVELRAELEQARWKHLARVEPLRAIGRFEAEYRACVDAEQLWKRSDPSGADLTGSLEAASRQRLKSPLVEHNYRL